MSNAAGRIISWLMGIPRETSLCSDLDDAIDELSIVHAPLAKPSDRLPQLVAIIREPIFRFRRHLLIDGAFQKPVAFEVPESLDQHLLGNIRDLLLQLVEASVLPYRQGVKDDGGPLVSDDRQDAPCWEAHVESVRLCVGRHQTFQDSRAAPEARLLVHGIMPFLPGICGRRRWPSRLHPRRWRRA